MWKKFHLQTFVTSFFSCSLMRRKFACKPFVIFRGPSAPQNFKIGLTCKCSSHSSTGEKRSLTVGKIFFTQKRDNYTNKVLFSLIWNWTSVVHCMLSMTAQTAVKLQWENEHIVNLQFLQWKVLQCSGGCEILCLYILT